MLTSVPVVVESLVGGLDVFVPGGSFDLTNPLEAQLGMPAAYTSQADAVRAADDAAP